MTDVSKKAQQFVLNWSNNNFNYSEKGNTAPFWIDLLKNVYGVNNVSNYIGFEKKVPNMDDNINFIDAYIPRTKVLIEQKSPDINLTKKEYRPSFTSYNSKVTPFEQAKTYSDNLKYSERPRWIIICNFKTFVIYDMDKSGTHPQPVTIKLAELQRYYYKMDFLVDPTRQDIQKETKVSLQACDIIDKIYHELLKQYRNEDIDSKVLSDINKTCVRLVFCMYADDSGIFGKHGMFEDYMKAFPAKIWNMMLKKLFNILNQPEEERNSQDDRDVLKFPFVNGGMFDDGLNNDIQIPRFTEEMKKLIINQACAFDWSNISPTIFGSLFEGTLNPRERHASGMHYTSVENIHKIIDPLFLDNLRDELNTIKTRYKSINAIQKHAKNFQNKLASLTFLDPACGSGNFLTETYINLRKLENEAIKLMYRVNGGYVQNSLGLNQNIIKVSIHQFYGIEKNDFATSVSKTAMWIAESQLMTETQDIINQNIDFLPLKSNANIIEGNALEVNWTKVIKPYHLDFIISNPPFAGDKKTKQQRNDMKQVMTGFKSVGKLDYVTAWYKKAADMMKQSHHIQTTLVSTNSIVLGQQVPLLWEPLLKDYGLHINFCYQSFEWENDAKNQASVSCVIISISYMKSKNKKIFKNNGKKIISNVKNINPYLQNMSDVFITRRSSPINNNVNTIMNGSKPTDGGHLSKYFNSDIKTICDQYPQAKKFFKPFLGAYEFMNNKKRWCLWLKDSKPEEWGNIYPIYNAIINVKHMRENSKDKTTRKNAKTPMLFQATRQPTSNYLLIPHITSLNRKYIPIGFMNQNIKINNSVFAVPNADYYDFGILSSIVHSLWAKLVSGRMRNDSLFYSDSITYNNFPYMKLTEKQKENINNSAYKILNIRQKYSDKTLAYLYNPDTMPLDLLQAHQENDRRVAKVYGLKSTATEQEILTQLLKLYTKIINH